MKEYMINGEWKDNIYYGQPFYEKLAIRNKRDVDVLLVEFYDPKKRELHLYSNKWFNQRNIKKRVINIDKNLIFPVFDTHLSLALKYILQLMKYLMINGESFSLTDVKSIIDIFFDGYISLKDGKNYFSKIYQTMLDMQCSSMNISVISNSSMIVTEFRKPFMNDIIHDTDPGYLIFANFSNDYSWNDSEHAKYILTNIANDFFGSTASSVLERFLTGNDPSKYISIIDSIEPAFNRIKLILLFLQYIESILLTSSDNSNYSVIRDMMLKCQFRDDFPMNLFVNHSGHLLIIDIIHKIYLAHINNEDNNYSLNYVMYKCMYYCCKTLQLLVIQLKKYLKNSKNANENIAMVIDTCVECILNIMNKPLFISWIQTIIKSPMNSLRDIHWSYFLKSLIIHPKVIDLLFADHEIFRVMCFYLFEERKRITNVGKNPDFMRWEIKSLPFLIEFWLHFIQFSTLEQRTRIMISFDKYSNEKQNIRRIPTEHILCNCLMDDIRLICAWGMIDLTFVGRNGYSRSLSLTRIDDIKKLQIEEYEKLFAIRLMIEDYQNMSNTKISKSRIIYNEQHGYCFAFFNEQMRDKLYAILMKFYNGNGQRMYCSDLNVVCLDLLSTYFEQKETSYIACGNKYKLDDILGMQQKSFYENIKRLQNKDICEDTVLW